MAKYHGDELKRLSGKERLGMHRESEYLGAEDIEPGTEPILTIEGIYYGKCTLQRGKEYKDVICFVEKSVPGIMNVRPLIMNSTNRKTLRKLYKKVDAETLEGKKIQLFIDSNVKDATNGGITDGIRIRPTIPVVKVYVCEDCGQEVKDDSGLTAHQIATMTNRKYGKTLCCPCGAKAKQAAELNQKGTDILEDNED